MGATSDNSICRRIAQIRAELTGPRGKSKFAQLLGISPSTYDYYESSRIPPANILVRISAVSGVDLAWLLTGEGGKASGVSADHPAVQRVAELLADRPDAAEPLWAFLDLLADVSQLPAGVGEAATAPAKATLPLTPVAGPSADADGADRLFDHAELIPILGRSAAGVPQFWAEGQEGQTTALADLIRRHAGRAAQKVRPAGVEGADDQAAAQIITFRDEQSDEVCQFVRAAAIRARHPDAFALQIDGSSMAPDINHGDMVILSPTAPAADGRAAVVQLAGQIGVTCKLYRRSGDDIHLVPISDELSVISVFDTEVIWALRVLARVRPDALAR